MSGSILILGATGMIGRRLVPMLAAQPHDVRAASRTPDAGQTGFDWYRPDTNDGAIEGVEAMFVVPPAMEADAAPLVGALLARAAAADVRRVVLASSMGGDSPGAPATSDRWQIEARVRESGMEWTILRPSGFMQNFSEGFLFPGIAQFGAVNSATGDGLVALVDAVDIARVAAATLTKPGHDGAYYDVTGPEPISFGQAVAAVSEAAGRHLFHNLVSSEQMLAILQQAGVPDTYAAMLIRDQLAIRDGEAAAVSDAVETVTGQPPRSFGDFVAENTAVWKTA